MDDSIDLAERLRATQPNTLTKLAAATMAATGVMTASAGLQVIDLSFRSPVVATAPYAMVLLGVLATYLSLMTFRTRAWACVAATAVGGVITIGMASWLIFSFSNGVFSLFALFAPEAALAATVMTGLSIPHCRRAAAMRRSLSSSGMELGI